MRRSSTRASMRQGPKLDTKSLMFARSLERCTLPGIEVSLEVALSQAIQVTYEAIIDAHTSGFSMAESYE